MKRRLSILSLLTLASILAACLKQIARTARPLKPSEQLTETQALPPNSSAPLKLVIDGAIDQVGKTTSYDNSYHKIDYPTGDVPIENGVCADVLFRALRQADSDLNK